MPANTEPFQFPRPFLVAKLAWIEAELAKATDDVTRARWERWRESVQSHLHQAA